MNFVIRTRAPEPVSAQIARQIADAVARGEFRPGEKLPSVRKLTRELGVAFNTVLRAYADLQRMGLVYSLPAKGVYVSPAAHLSSPPRPSPGPGSPERERVHFLALTDAFIAQAERCGLDLDDAVSELKVRARIRRKKGSAKEVERAVKEEMRRKAKRAEEEYRREKEARRGKGKGKKKRG